MTPYSVALTAFLAGAAGQASAARDHGGWFTAERIANLRANCERFDWARSEREGVVSAVAAYVDLSDDFIWRLVPGPELPRRLYVCHLHGEGNLCPSCGDKIDRHGNYPYSYDIVKNPWKLTCPECAAVFPTNDFGKYYASGLDEAGEFDPARADRRLLFNQEHPDAADPLHTYGVDDGTGWVDEEGRRYHFIAYYSHWAQFGTIIGGVLPGLANAYVYTGERTYAHKALILLDRLADLYPRYEGGYINPAGQPTPGKVTDYIWECGTITTMARAVDMVLSGTKDDPELYAFLGAKAREYKLPRPKGTREQLVANLDDGILREGAKAVMDRTALGNQGMHQRAIAACALALDQNPDTERWLDWLFEPQGAGWRPGGGGGLPGFIVGKIDRDGVGPEAGLGYALSWGRNFGQVADWLADYDGYDKHDVYRDFPQFTATITAPWNLVIMGYASPNIADSGSTGACGRASSAAEIIGRYKYVRDPAIALAAYHANDQEAEGLGRDIFAADPDWVAKEVAAIVSAGKANPFVGGRNRSGYGLASIEFGWGKPGTALWIYYGRSVMHGHADRFNWDIYYRGM